MAGDSAFRRLLLDTVATAITQTPSSSSLIELLRIATHNLVQCEDANAKIRNASKREKLFRALQLRIHPDKHPGDERATVLFQEVTLFYGRCVEVMDDEDRRAARIQSSASNNCKNDRTEATTTTTSRNNDHYNNDGGTTDRNINGHNTKYPQWKDPWWYRHNNNPQTKNNPHSPRSSRGTPRTAHSDYENAQYYNSEQSQSTFNPQDESNGIRTRGTRRGGTRQPSSHQAFAVLSATLFLPLGLCALVHSFRVQKAWREERYSDARHHSEQAYCYAWLGCLCFCFIFLYLWLSDGGVDWDWDRIKHNLPWDDGP